LGAKARWNFQNRPACESHAVEACPWRNGGMGRKRCRMEVKRAGGVDFDEVHLGSAPRPGRSARSRGGACGQTAGTFQIPLEGTKAEPLVAGKLDLRQTAFPEAYQKLANFKGAAVAPRGDGMLHAGNAASRRKSAVDAVARAHTVFLPKGSMPL